VGVVGSTRGWTGVWPLVRWEHHYNQIFNSKIFSFASITRSFPDDQMTERLINISLLPYPLILVNFT
jgi:hypothetical protein